LTIAATDSFELYLRNIKEFLYIYTLFVKEILTFKLSITSSNVNRFSKFFQGLTTMKFASKPIWHYPPHLSHVAKLPWEIKNFNLLLIFGIYGRKCKQIAV